MANVYLINKGTSYALEDSDNNVLVEWDTTGTVIGGQFFGVGMDWVDKSPSRSSGVPYTNNTNTSKLVSIWTDGTISSASRELTVDGKLVARASWNGASSGVGFFLIAIVPPGGVYSINSLGAGTYEWHEYEQV